jgi:hypothetical protein
MHRILEGRASEEDTLDISLDAMASFFKATLEPFTGLSIATEPLISAARVVIGDGRTQDGTLVRAPGTPLGDTGLAVAHAFWDSLEPGTVTALIRAFEAATEKPMEPTKLPRDMRSELESSLMGMRWTRLRPVEGLTFAVSDYNRELRGMTSMTPKLTDTPQDVLERYRRINEAHYDSQQRLYRKVDTYRVLGMPHAEIYNILEEEGLSEDSIDYLMAGKYRPPIDLNNLMMNTFDKIFTEERRDIDAYTMTWRQLERELARESAAMTGVSLDTFAEEANQSINPHREEAIEVLRTGRR